MRNNILFINLLLDSNTVVEKRNLFCVIQQWFAFFKVSIERRSGKSNESTKFTNNGIFVKFLESIDDCSFYYGESKEDTDLEFLNWQVFANINFENNSLTFAVCENFIRVKVDELINYLISQLSGIKVVYGYAFFEDKIIGFGYAMGVVLFDVDNDNDKSDELAERVVIWTDALDNGMYLKKLRNIYSYNLFSSSLFRVKIDGLNIESWVKENSIGIITKINDTALWELKEDEMENVKNIFIKKKKIWEVL